MQFFKFFLVCSAGLDIICSGTLPHQLKSYKFDPQTATDNAPTKHLICNTWRNPNWLKKSVQVQLCKKGRNIKKVVLTGKFTKYLSNWHASHIRPAMTSICGNNTIILVNGSFHSNTTCFLKENCSNTLVATRSSYTMMAKPIRALELHYPMIQFLIKTIIPCSPNKVPVRVCSKFKTSWKSVVNKVSKNSQYFVGFFNKTIIPLPLVGYEMIIANSANLDHWINGILLESSK